MSAPRPSQGLVPVSVPLGRVLASIADGVRHDVHHQEPPRLRGDERGEAPGDRAQGRGLCPTHEALLQRRSGAGGVGGQGWRGPDAGPAPGELIPFAVTPQQIGRMILDAVVLVAFFGGWLTLLIALTGAGQ